MARGKKKRKIYDPTSEWTDEQRQRIQDASQNLLPIKAYMGQQSSGRSSGGGTSTPTQTQGNPYAPVGSDPSEVNLPVAPRNYHNNWPEWAKAAAIGDTGQQPKPNVTAAQPFPNSGRDLELLAEAAAAGSLNAAQELKSRQQAIGEYAKNPQKWAEENSIELNQEQSLIEKGTDFMARLFNYEDESDLQVFGMNLSPIESIWDEAVRWMTGGRNVLDTLITAAISAMPGGVDTLEWGQITDNHSFGEVLHGDIGMIDNVGPSPMQTAIASVAIEAKRIREGGARLSDVLLLNPAIAPFILAGIAAEDSPLQKDDFNLLDPEKRKAGFAEGWEKWMSGLGDFGVQMAAPSMAAGAVLKVGMSGALGVAKGGQRGASVARVGIDAATDEVFAANHQFKAASGQAPAWEAPTMASRAATATETAAQRNVRIMMLRDKTKNLARTLNVPDSADDADLFFKEMEDRGLTGGRTAEEAKASFKQGKENFDKTPDDAIDGLPQSQRDEINFAKDMDDLFTNWQADQIRDASKRTGIDLPEDFDRKLDAQYVTKSSDELGIKTPLARLINDIAQIDPVTGKKVMSMEHIKSRLEFRRNPYKAEIGSLLHAMTDPYDIAITLRSLHGDRQALRLLEQASASVADTVYRLRMKQAQNASLMEPTKMRAVHESIDKQIANLEGQLDNYQKHGWVDPAGDVQKELRGETAITLTDRVDTLHQSIAELKAVKAHFNGEAIDTLAPGPFHDPVRLERVLRDMEIKQDALHKAATADIKQALASQSDYGLITKNNWIARTVNANRERSARARWEYLQEGSSFSRRLSVKSMDMLSEGPNKGRMAARVEHGFSMREFATAPISAGRRAARVWRFYGAESPAGYISLKGGGLAQSSDELKAALDLDLYYGAPAKVSYVQNGEKIVDELVGGAERRAELQAMWDDALTNPAADRKTIIMQIEQEIADDMRKAYGIDVDHMAAQIKDANRLRSQSTDMVKKHGMFVDPDSTTVNHIPYLKGQLANGHYMQNWHEVEHRLQQHALNTYGPRAGSATRKFGRIPMKSAKAASALNNTLQNVWRPAVLFRLAYPVRNNVEGIGRAMGYYASLAPIIWPLDAGRRALQGKVVNKMAERATRNVIRDVHSSEAFKQASQEFMDANKAHVTLKTAPIRTFTRDEWDFMAKNGEIPAEWADDFTGNIPMRYIYERGENGPRITRRMSNDEWADEVTAAHQRIIDANGSLADVEKAFDDAVKGTKFGKWRERQLKAIDDELDASCGAAQGFTVAGMNMAAGGSIGVTEMAGFIEGQMQHQEMLRRTADLIRYDPTAATSIYKDMAGRRTRIGAGTSIGPDGGTYADAFADPFAVFNRNLASADTTRKMQLGAESDAWTNMFLNNFRQENRVVEYSAATRSEWVDAMSQQIEHNAWNPLVQRLMGGPEGTMLDVDDAVTWMMTTDEGRDFLHYQRQLEGSDFETGQTIWEDMPMRPGESSTARAATMRGRVVSDEVNPEDLTTSKRSKVVTERLRPTADYQRSAVTGRWETIDNVEAATKYATHVAQALRWQMQDMPEFFALQKMRAESVRTNTNVFVNAEDVDDVLKSLTPQQLDNLGAVRGDVTITLGELPYKQKYQAMVSKMFEWIGTIPEDAITRMPFYNKRFKQVRNDLIANYWAEEDMLRHGVDELVGARGVKTGYRDPKTGAYDPDGITHGERKIKTKDLQEIMAAAHRQALYDTKQTLFTMDRRTNMGKHLEGLSPFISATQNTVTAIGKILYKNPWEAPLVAKLWAMPYKNGTIDENGNLVMPYPIEWIDEAWSKIPLAGASPFVPGEYMTVPANSLNVWMPDTGFFGVVPRPGPLVNWTASELIRRSWLGMSAATPEALVTLMGEEQATQTWNLMKDWVFGEEFGISSRPMSYDVWVPPYIRSLLDAADKTSAAYAYNYDLEGRQRTLIARANGEPPPTPDEIARATTNKLIWNAAGAFGLTGGMARPEIHSPMADAAIEVLQSYIAVQGQQDENGNYIIAPNQAYASFEAQFGPEVFEMAMTGMTNRLGSGKASPDTVADIQALDSTIRNVLPTLNGQYEILDMIVNNNSYNDPYDADADRWMKATNIGQTSTLWAANYTGEELAIKRKQDLGWTEYHRFQDELEQDMYNAGLRNMQQAGAAPLREKKLRWEANMQRSNPEWWADYQDGSEKRIAATVSTLETITQDDTFVRRMMDTGNEDLVRCMREYVYYRRQAVIAQQESGYTWGSPENIQLRAMWDEVRQSLAQSNIRWADIQTRWLNQDDEPSAKASNLGIDTLDMEAVLNG